MLQTGDRITFGIFNFSSNTFPIFPHAARYFLTRALLGVENFVQAQQTLRNEDYGAAEGFSVNMTFLAQEGDRMFHNAEVGPAEADTARSQLNILTVSLGENTSHCNKYVYILTQIRSVV